MKRVGEILSMAIAVALAGCGGSGGGMAGGGSTGGGGTGGGGGTQNGISGSPSVLAATFQVDVNSGAVSILSPKGSLSGSERQRPGMFTGNSIEFKSSQLTNDTFGGTGVRRLQVSLLNHTDFTIGVDRTGIASGLNVIFGAFVNTTGVQDQRPNTTVSTFAGSTPGFANGTSGAAQFKNPAGTAVGPDGAIYVADFGNNRIRKISSGTVSTFAGSGTAAETDGGPTFAAFKGPYALALNPIDGALIVADFSGNTVRRVTATGVVNTVAGTGAAGSANGAGNTATFTNPSGVAVDASGNIYVSEAGSNRIRKIVLAGGSPNLSAHYLVSAFAGNGTGGHVDGIGPSAEFFKPFGLACDSLGNVYVADFENNMVRMVDSSGNVSTIAGSGTESDLDGYGNAATFNRPFGIASLNGALFVTDSSGERVREVIPAAGGGNGPSSWVVETLAGTGAAGSADGVGNAATFQAPYGITASRASSLFVSDFGDGRIREVDPSSGTFPIGTIGASTNAEPVQLSNPTGTMDGTDFGTAPYITYPGSIAPATATVPISWDFVVPSGVTSFQFQVMVEANTNTLILLQGAVGAGSPLVDVRTLAGNPSALGFVNGPPTTALFGTPARISIDSNGLLYVVDRNNSAIRRVDPSGFVSTVAGAAGTVGSPDGTGSVAAFNGPFGVVANPNGKELLVTDELNNEIRRIAFSGGDPTDPANWQVSTIAGSLTAGFADGPGASSQFDFPNGLVMVSPDTVYVSEFQGNRIRSLRYVGGDRSSPSSWVVATVAGDNTQTSGASGTTNGRGTVARFDGPEGMCVDGKGNLYVAEPFPADIRKIDSGANVTTLSGTAGAGYLDGSLATAKFNFPGDLTIDSAGYIYVADALNNVIRCISPGGIVTTVAGTTTIGHVDGPGNTAQFNTPFGLAINPSGTLFVAGNEENDIRVIQTAVASATPP